MGRGALVIGLALALIAAFTGHGSAQSAGCTPAIVSLMPCVGYITGNSSAAPSSACCSQLASVVQTQARCLCTVLNSGAASLGLTINQTQALTLPGACKVQTPPLSQCNAATAAPAEAPSSTSPSIPSSPSNPASEAPSTPSVPTGTSSTTTPSTTPVVPSSGSKTVPTTSGQSSDGISIESSRSMMFVTFFAAGLFCSSL